MMDKLYPNDAVFYFALFYQAPLPVDHLFFGKNFVTDDIRNQVTKVYPFAVHATDAMISFLLETNRINCVDDNIKEINSGLQFEDCNDDIIPHMNKVSYLDI